MLSLLILIPSATFVSVSADESASPKHIPRIVSIVFDDSASMAGKGYDENVITDEDFRWAYASYAMQAFIAMMGEEDVLYVTYLNDEEQEKNKTGIKSGKVNLGTQKKNEIEKLKKLLVEGGTDNELETGYKKLEEAYGTYKNNAEYYLVVMADGQLDQKTTFHTEDKTFSSELLWADGKVKEFINGADFETIFFMMGDSVSVNGLNGISISKAESSKEIISSVKDISAAIMGRTDITSESTVNGGNLSFTLKYPAHNISLLVQKENSPFGNIVLPITSDQKNTSFKVESFNLDCPEPSPIVTPNYTLSVEHHVPENRPYGFVSLITNKDTASPLPKGNYSIDLSAYGIDKSNVVVLVEPAVKLGCEYYVGDDPDPLSFSDIKDKLHEGDSFAIKCGLYEIEENGKLGAKVSSDVLNPAYTLYINGKPVTNSDTENGSYVVTMQKDYEGKELKIEATLDGYQPFVQKESLGKIKERPVIDTSALTGDSAKISLTKPLYNNWANGKNGIEFPFSNLYSGILDDLEIKIEGANGFNSGKCSELSEVKTSGKSIIYTPKASRDFNSLPQSFSVSVCLDGESLLTRNVEVIKPQYKIETEKDLLSTQLSIIELQANKKAITYTIVADYENDGKFIPISESACDKGTFSIELNSTTLPGKLTKEKDSVSFVPSFDPKDKKAKTEDILNKEHKLSATAKVGDTTLNSEEITVFISSSSYIIKLDNSLPETFSVDTLKSNKDKMTFTLLADYEGGENYGPLAEIDKEIYETLKIETAGLPGEIVKESDGSLSFVPNLGSDSPASILGKEHKIYATASVNGSTIQSEAFTIAISKAAYKISAESEISEDLSLDSLKNNQKKIVYTILADYSGGEKFGPLAKWDTEIANGLVIDNGELPGKIETVYDGNLPVGKSFTPQYDENAAGAVPYTAITGIDVKKIHPITASLEQVAAEPCKVEVSVLAPKHTVSVRKDGITVVDVELTKNTDGVEFEILRDARVLSKTELEALDCNIYLNKNKKHIGLDVKPIDAGDGTGYLFVRPCYNGWTFISPSLWEWANLFLVSDGDTEIILSFNDQMVSATMHVNTNPLVLIIFWVVLGVIAFVAYFTFCCITRIRFIKGKIYRATFRKNSVGDWNLIDVNVIKKRPYVLPHHVLLPFKSMRKRVCVFEHSAELIAPRAFGLERTYPHWTIERKPTIDITPEDYVFNTGALNQTYLDRILAFDTRDTFEEGRLIGHQTRFDPKEGISINLVNEFICEVQDKQLAIVFFRGNGN